MAFASPRRPISLLPPAEPPQFGGPVFSSIPAASPTSTLLRPHLPTAHSFQRASVNLNFVGLLSPRCVSKRVCEGSGIDRHGISGNKVSNSFSDRWRGGGSWVCGMVIVRGRRSHSIEVTPARPLLSSLLQTPSARPMLRA